MSMGKYGNRKDNNHKDIIKAFIALGFVVLDVSNLANCCDIFVSKNGYTVAVEIKNPELHKSNRKLTSGERKFAEMWVIQGHWMLIENLIDVEFLNQHGLECDQIFWGDHMAENPQEVKFQQITNLMKLFPDYVWTFYDDTAKNREKISTISGLQVIDPVPFNEAAA